MALTFKLQSESMGAKKRYTRKAITPTVDLTKPGRLRVAELQALFSISHTTVYKRIQSGDLPPPDGWDLANRPQGKRGRPYWHTGTILPFMKEKAS